MLILKQLTRFAKCLLFLPIVRELAHAARRISLNICAISSIFQRYAHLHKKSS